MRPGELLRAVAASADGRPVELQTDAGWWLSVSLATDGEPAEAPPPSPRAPRSAAPPHPPPSVDEGPAAPPAAVTTRVWEEATPPVWEEVSADAEVVVTGRTAAEVRAAEMGHDPSTVTAVAVVFAFLVALALTLALEVRRRSRRRPPAPTPEAVRAQRRTWAADRVKPMSALPSPRPRKKSKGGGGGGKAPAGGSRRFARLEEDGDVLGDVALVDCGEASPGGSAQALEDVEAQVEAALAKARGVAAAGTPAAPDDDEPPPWVRPSSVGERPPPPRSEVNVVADDGELYALD